MNENAFDMDLTVSSVGELRSLAVALNVLMNTCHEISISPDCNDAIECVIFKHWLECEDLAKLLFKEIKSRDLTDDERLLIEHDLELARSRDYDTSQIEWLLNTQKPNEQH